MLKRFLIEMLRLTGGVGGNIIAGGIKENNWTFALTLDRLPGTLIGVVLISFIIVLLENKRSLLGCIRDRRAVKSLISVMRNSDQSVRRNAAEALGKIGDPRAVELLIATWREPRPFSFSFRHWTDKYSTGVDLDSFGECVAFVLIGIGETAIPSLITALSDLNTNVYLSAEYCLAKIGKAAIPRLMMGLCHQNSNVRARSAEVLGKMSGPNAFGGPLYWNIEVNLEISRNIGHSVGPLIAVLLDEDSKVRSNAAHALTNIVDFRNIRQVLNLIRDSNSDISENVAKKSEKIGYSYFVESLFAALRDSEPNVRSAASKLLGRIRDTRAVEPLVSVLHDTDAYVRSCAADALGKIGDSRAVEPLVMTLGDSDKNVRSSATSALEKINKPHNPHVVEEIIILPIDDSLAQVAREALEKIRQRMAKIQKRTD